MNLKPRKLILHLLRGATEPVSSQMIIRLCEIFDITENSARVTLARLVAENLLEAPARGQYQLGSAAMPLTRDLAGWHHMEERVRDWNGCWIAVFVAHLGRGDRAALKRRMRVLQLSGFAELEQGLLIRPDNLKDGVDGVRKRLYKLGLEAQARVYRIDGMTEQEQAHAMTLWDVAELEKHYIESSQQLQDWMDNAKALDSQTALRESFMIGDNALRQLFFDPLLPAEMIDVSARQHYLATMIEYERAGKEIWAALYQQYKQQYA